MIPTATITTTTPPPPPPPPSLLRAAVFVADEADGSLSYRLAIQRADPSDKRPVTVQERDKSPAWCAARDVAEYLSAPRAETPAMKLFLAHQNENS